MKSFIKELLKGKSLPRVLQNLEFSNLDFIIEGKVLDIASGNNPSYKRYIKYSSDSIWTTDDYDKKYEPDLCFDASEPWPVKEQYYDWVMMINCIYIFSNPKFIIDQAVQTLNNGGRMIITFPFIFNEVPVIFNEVPEPTDYFRMTKQGIKLLFKDTGLTVQKILPYGGRFTCAVDLISAYLKKLCLFLPFAILAYKLDKLEINGKNKKRKYSAYSGYIVEAKKEA